MISKLIEKLKNPEYRKAFVASAINLGIPMQIRALMKSRGWKQEDLVSRTGMLQPRISAILKPGKVRPNIETLRRLADAFDCGLDVRFVPFSELALRQSRFDPENFRVPSFEMESHGGALESIKAYDRMIIPDSDQIELGEIIFKKPPVSTNDLFACTASSREERINVAR